MSIYELPLLIRVMNKPELISTLKRTAQSIFDKGGIIRKIDNLGTNQLPYKATVHGTSHWQASQFVVHFNLPPRYLKDIADDYRRDLDILNFAIYKQNEPTTVECTFHEDLLPAPYRPAVQKMVEFSKKREERKLKRGFQTGVKHYPFQR